MRHTSTRLSQAGRPRLNQFDFEPVHERVQAGKPMPLAGERVFQAAAPHDQRGLLSAFFPEAEEIGAISGWFAKVLH